MSEENMVNKEVQAIINYADTFNSETGRKVLDDLIAKFNYLGISYSLSASASDVAFKEGQRNVICYIIQAMNQDPALLLKNYLNNKKKEQEYDDFSN